MAMGLGSTAAPWLVMQPAVGLGVATAKTPDPTATRLPSLRTHAISAHARPEPEPRWPTAPGAGSDDPRGARGAVSSDLRLAEGLGSPFALAPPREAASHTPRSVSVSSGIRCLCQRRGGRKEAC